jgi:carbon monoxide dehydrogenase subunit G
MTVRVERTFEFDAPPSAIWGFIADPEKRARPISVVTDFETTGDRTARWQVKLPIPVINRTLAIETEDVDRRENEFVRFVGKSKVMNVQGEHELEETEDGCLLHNRFVVDGQAPGVETFFKRNLDDELDNIEAAIGEEISQ